MHEQKFAENGVFWRHRARESQTAIWGGKSNETLWESYSLLEYVIKHKSTCNIMPFNVCSILMAINCSHVILNTFGSNILILHLKWGYFHHQNS